MLRASCQRGPCGTNLPVVRLVRLTQNRQDLIEILDLLLAIEDE